MTILVVITLVLALLAAVAGVLALRRLLPLQAQLARLAQLDALDQRLAALAAQVERREFSVALQAKLTEVTEALARLSGAVAALQEQVAAPPAARAPAPVTDVLVAVREHLAAQRYAEVRLLTDAGQLPGRSGRVVFEARRDGVLHKGHALLEDGQVVEERAQAAWSTFP